VPATSLGAPTTCLGAHGSAVNKPRSAGDKSGSILNHSEAVWEKQHLLWECCWCAWKSELLLIIQRFLKLMYSVCVPIHFSMYLYSYPSTHSISGLAADSVMRAIRGAPQNDNGVNSGIHSGAVIERVWRSTLEAVIERVWRCTSRPRSSDFGYAIGGHDRATLDMHLEAVIRQI